MSSSAPDRLSPAPVRSRKGSRRRRKGAGRVTAQLAVVMTVVLALTVSLGSMYYFRKLNSNIEHSDAQDRMANRPKNEVIDTGTGEPVDILVMGSDFRVDGSRGNQELSDTTILVHLSADRKRAYGISIPRDLVVPRPDCVKEDGTNVPGSAESPWNDAFSYAGEACTMQQFEQWSGVKLEHQVVVRFPGFKSMVDALGGVRMCVPATIEDSYLNWTLPAGKNVLLKGDDALNYVRSRHGSGDGSDISRTRRQQAFIGAMVKKALSNGTLSDLGKITSFLEAATKSLKTDMNITGLATLGMDFQGIGLDDIQFLTIPNAYYTSESRWYNKVYPVEPAAEDVWRAIRKDKPIPARFLEAMTTAKKGGTATKATEQAGKSKDPSDGQTTDSSQTPSNPTDEAYVDRYADPEFNGLCG